MTTIQIEKNIPIPDTYRIKVRWPLGEMSVGDSIAVPKEDVRKAKSIVAYYSRKNGIKFCTRSQENGSMRIWRIQ